MLARLEAGLKNMLGLASEALSSPRLMLTGGALSHPGLVRPTNEDTVAYSLPGALHPASTFGALAVVADGMGGHLAGEVASQIATETICRLYYRIEGSVPHVLAQSFAAANAAIWQRSQEDPDCAGMGTTCTAIAVRDNRAFLAHVGDSRAYLLRGGNINQISQDDSLVDQLVREGRITPADAKRSPDRNIILKALGTKPQSDPMICQTGLPLHPGDVLVLCSDGLSDLVDDHVIRETVRGRSPEEACTALVQSALAAGGHDNVSVGIFRVGLLDASTENGPGQAQGSAP